MSSTVLANWRYECRNDELEALRWYLTGRLDVNVKLTYPLGNAVAIYELLRHLSTPPEYPDSLTGLVQTKPTLALALLNNPVVAEIVLSNGFREVPFYRLLPKTQAAIIRWISYTPSVYCEDIRALHARDVYQKQIERAQAMAAADSYVPAEIKCSPEVSVISFTIFHSHGLASVQRGFAQWLKANKHRFPKGGRAAAGLRQKDNPCYKLKDVAVARLLSLNKFDPDEANTWTEYNQPCDKDGKHFAWFRNKGENSRGPLFRNRRDWKRSLNRFEKSVANLIALAMA